MSTHNVERRSAVVNAIERCELARERHKNRLLWRNLWTILLFVFGVAVVLTLVVTIAFVRDGKYIEMVASTLGTVASGVAVNWVVARRNDARDEEESAWQDVKELCQAQAADFSPDDDLRSRYRLFGRWL